MTDFAIHAPAETARPSSDSIWRNLAFWGLLPTWLLMGFALILPPSLNIDIALGAVTAAVWRKAAPGDDGGFERYAAPVASGLIAGEAMVGSILMPAVAMLLEVLRR